MLTFLQDLTKAWRFIRQQYQRMNRWTRRAFWLGVMGFWSLIVAMGPAYSEDINSGPAVTSWMNIKDTHGVSVWGYSLSMDNGGLTSPLKALCSFFTNLTWELYRVFIVTALWLIDWVLSFTWLNTIAAPIQTLGDSLQGVVDTFGASAAFLTIAGVMGGFWLLRGKYALGIYEFLTTCVVATLATGMFANPVAVVGGSDGWLMNARDLGLGVAARMSVDGSNGALDDANADEVRTRISSELATTFIRIPSQLINFGKIVEAGPCAPVYETLTKPTKGSSTIGLQSSDAYKTFEYCADKSVKKKAENPSVDMIISALFLAIAGVGVLIFALVLLAAVMLAACYALYAAVKAVITLVVGLLPGNARAPLAMTFAEILTSLALVVFSIVFLMSYLMVINSLFVKAGNSTGSLIKSFMFIDMMLFVGIAIFWKGRKALRRSSERLSQSMLKRPSGAPSKLSAHAPAGGGMRRVARLGTQAAMYRKAGALGGTAGSGGGIAGAIGATAAAPLFATYLAARGVGVAAKKMYGAAGGGRNTRGEGQPANSSVVGNQPPSRPPASGMSGVPFFPAGPSGTPNNAHSARLQRARARHALPSGGSSTNSLAAAAITSPSNPRRQELGRRLDLPVAAANGSSETTSQRVNPHPRPQPAGNAGFQRVTVNGQVLLIPRKKPG